jgi:hypothetical protein
LSAIVVELFDGLLFDLNDPELLRWGKEELQSRQDCGGISIKLEYGDEESDFAICIDENRSLGTIITQFTRANH